MKFAVLIEKDDGDQCALNPRMVMAIRKAGGLGDGTPLCRVYCSGDMSVRVRGDVADIQRSLEAAAEDSILTREEAILLARAVATRDIVAEDRRSVLDIARRILAAYP